MIKKYWISKWTREWGIIEEEFDGNRGARYSAPWTSDIPKSRDLLDQFEDTGFVLLNRIEFLILSKTLDERGEPLRFSPFPPEGPAADSVSYTKPRRPTAPFRVEAMPVAA